MGGHRTGLAGKLLSFRQGLLSRMQPQDAALLRAAADQPLDPPPLGIGQAAPPFVLADQHGRPVALADRLALGPVVLVFVRGGWCPFCTETLRAYQDLAWRIQDAGGDMLAVTAETAEQNATTAERDLLCFPLLSDADHQVMRAYGVAYELPEALRPVYRRLGHDLGQHGPAGWELSRPATFVIEAGGRIALSAVGVAEYQRLEPDTAIEAVRTLVAVPHALAPAEGGG